MSIVQIGGKTITNIFIGMKPDFFRNFRNKLWEEEVTPINNQSTLEKILGQSKKLPEVLTKLLTTEKTYNEEAKKQIREVVSDIRCVSYKPTIFRIVIPNGNFFELKYDPVPMEQKFPDDFEAKDSFVVLVSGKKYNIVNRSEYEQAVEYINQLLKNNPITKEEQPEDAPAETPEETPEETPSPEEEDSKEA